MTRFGHYESERRRAIHAMIVSVIVVLATVATLLGIWWREPARGQERFDAGVKSDSTSDSPRDDLSRQATGCRGSHCLASVNLKRLAKACFTEATGSEADCAAMHALIERKAKRAGKSYDAMLSAYTAVDRCKRIPTDREWAQHLDIAAKVLSGEIRNPCGVIDHFGGLSITRDADNARRMVHAGKWVLVVCSAHTFNSYFREVR